MVDKKLIALEARKELARRDFFEYCKIMAPDFYMDSRGYQMQMCHEMQDFFFGDDDVLVVNEPPRFGKSRTAGKFTEWLLGLDQTTKVITGSYNKTLSTTFSKNVRDTIMEQKVDKDKIVYSDIFPRVKIKRGDGAVNLWSLVGGYNNYLATSPDGTATGFGADLMIIDDLIKNAKEAYNANLLEEHWEWFSKTMLSRFEKLGCGAKLIIIMTRWSSMDLAGRALEFLSSKGFKIRHINFKAIKEDNILLCDEILNWKAIDMLKATQGDIFSANCQQEPLDLKGRLYTRFKTYSKRPVFDMIKAYCDTADTGADYLCSIVYGVYDGEAYILDIIYTQDPMEITEMLVAKQMIEYKVNRADIESNNGGRSFARNIRRLLKEKFGWVKTIVKWFHQSDNKQARIFSNSGWVQEHIYYPENWMDRWPEYYKAMKTYTKEGKNAHDDAQDATTGVAEKCNNIGGLGILK